MKALKLVGGSVVVYLAVAACGSGARLVATNDASAPQDSSIVDAIVDAVTDPVPEAQAGLPPIVAVEPCNKTFVISSTTWVYAEHAFPGKTKTDLASVQTLTHYLPGQMPAPPGYSEELGLPWARDGYSAQLCGTQPTPSVDSVTFILPVL